MIARPREEGAMSTDDNKALMQRFFDEVVNGGNVDLIDELLTDDFVEHEEFPGLEPNREGVKQFFRTFRSAFPDGTFSVEEMIAEGDTVATRVTIRGTHEGEFLGIPATGRSVEVAAIDFVSFEDGKMTAHWGVGDMVSMLQQLGVMPPPGG
jgi:steroid delta-isomerase-like uncharacterized protein